MKAWVFVVSGFVAVVEAAGSSTSLIGKAAAHYEWGRQFPQVPQQFPPPPPPPPPPPEWVPPTTTSIDWWPYRTTTTTADIPTYPTPNEAPQALPDPSPVPWIFSLPAAPTTTTTSSPDSAFSSLPTTLSSSTTTCTQSDCSTLSSSPSSSSPSTETQSLIQITALPASSASSTPTTLPKLKPASLNAKTSPRTRVILICVSATVGLLAGSAVAWFCFGCCMARRRRKGGGYWRSRKSREEPRAGPEYSSAWDDGADREKFVGQVEEEEGEEADAGDSRRSHRVSRVQSNFSWDIPTRAPSMDGERQSFLAPPVNNNVKAPSRHQTRKSARSAMRRNTTKSVYSTITGYEASPDPMSLLADFDEEDEEGIRTVGSKAGVDQRKPYESLRKGSKTIRRELLERVRQTSGTQARRGGEGLGVEGSNVGSARRRVSRGHARSDSDVFVEDGQVVDGRDLENSAETATEDDPTRWVQGSGFRIVEEEVKSLLGAVGEWATGKKSEGSSGGSVRDGAEERKSIFSSWVGKPNEDVDRYTPLPARSSPTKPKPRGRDTRASISTNMPSSANSRGGRTERRDREGDRPGLPRVDSSVLPRSPPQILSPPLASQLFFTPQVPQDGFPRRGGRG